MKKLLFLLLLATCAKPEAPFTLNETVIADGFRFTEGPVWHPDGYLLFSDIPANVVYRWSEESGVDTFLAPSGNSNGLAFDPNGRLVLAQHAGRVSVLGADGQLTALASDVDGNRLNSPNDLVYHKSGVLFFTDPYFGVKAEDRKLDYSGVYRLATDGTLSVVYDEFDLPNGVAFSPDQSVLYVCDSATGNIMKFDVDAVGNVSNPGLFAVIGEMTSNGGADGMKTDQAGRLYTTGPNGLIVFNPDGTEFYRKTFDQQITNLAWGGPAGTDLFLTSRDKVYRLRENQ